jgi:hypothetical protein
MYNVDITTSTAAYLLEKNKLNIFLNFDEIELRRITEIFSS